MTPPLLPGRSGCPFAHRLLVRAVDVYFVVDARYPVERDVMVLAGVILRELDRAVTLDVVDRAELPVFGPHDGHVRLDEIARSFGVQHGSRWSIVRASGAAMRAGRSRAVAARRRIERRR